jgi:hypothetical protein
LKNTESVLISLVCLWKPICIAGNGHGDESRLSLRPPDSSRRNGCILGLGGWEWEESVVVINKEFDGFWLLFETSVGGPCWLASITDERALFAEKGISNILWLDNLKKEKKVFLNK